MKFFYVLFIPALWLILAIISFYHPGDEYALFFVSTMAGSWIFFIIDTVGDVKYAPFYNLPIGVCVLAGIGYLMDKLSVSKLVWCLLFVLCSMGLIFNVLWQYPSYERAMSKNGSLTAYVSAACNMGIYLSIVLAIVINRLRSFFSA